MSIEPKKVSITFVSFICGVLICESGRRYLQFTGPGREEEKARRIQDSCVSMLPIVQTEFRKSATGERQLKFLEA